MKLNPEVDKFLAKKNHPLSNEINEVREIILARGDPGMDMDARCMS